MNTTQLLYCIRNDPRLNTLCVGVFPADRLPAPEAYPFCMIHNLDDSNKEGSHWTATYVDHDAYGFYFDSYGSCPPRRTETYLNRHCQDFMHSGKVVQSVYSSSCGQHCLYFLYRKANGDSLEEICDSYSNDLEKNDQIVTDFVNRTFDMNTVVVEPEYIAYQICKAFE